MLTKPNIVVVGSLNIDLVTSAEKFPAAGETVIGESFEKYPGGKGANQAVAAARLGGSVSMIGCVGADEHGVQIKNHLMNENINAGAVHIDQTSHTGVAQIFTADKENKIIVVPGANYSLNIKMVRNSADVIAGADIILLQLEIPMEVVEEVVRLAEVYNVPVILNPAPALNIPSTVLEGAAFLTPNEKELAKLTNIPLNSLEDYKNAAFTLCNNGRTKVIVTKGSDGVLYSDMQVLHHIPSHSVTVVDSTGAGDTFNGALAVALADTNSMNEAVKFANIAAAISTTKKGAQTAMPSRKEIENFMESMN
jgi:ribokinase